MNEEIMNEIQPVRPKDQFTFSCRQCGACCRNIEGCVMVESLDAYRLARYLRTKGEPIEGIEDFLFRYCEPEPLTEEGFPIYMLKTKAPNGPCIFLMDGRCSVYPARTRTCRIYPLTVGPGERGRDFEYCLCLDRHRSHFTGSRVSVKDWLYQNFKREDKEYVKREYEIATELGKLMRAIDPDMRQGIVFKVIYYRYYNFDLETAMGQRFFNVQLPALINTLKDIAAALSRPAPSAISFPADPRFLTSLYYGEYEADVFKLDKRLTPFNQAVQQKEKALLPLLSNEASIAFEQYQTAVQCRNSAVLEQAYASGYRTAVQMFAAGLGPQPPIPEHEEDSNG